MFAWCPGFPQLVQAAAGMLPVGAEPLALLAAAGGSSAGDLVDLRFSPTPRDRIAWVTTFWMLPGTWSTVRGFCMMRLMLVLYVLNLMELSDSMKEAAASWFHCSSVVNWDRIALNFLNSSVTLDDESIKLLTSCFPRISATSLRLLFSVEYLEPPEEFASKKR